jgi:hypothetical protein
VPATPPAVSSDTARQLLSIPWQRQPATFRDRARQLWNVINLSTLAGLLVAGVGGATLSRGPHGLILATGFRPSFPRAGAFTIGDVVISRRSRRRLLSRPALVHHESRHCRQYAWCLGLPMLPMYALCSIWSIVRTGDPASRNLFERLAGLADGDYVERPIHRRRRRRTTERAR